MPETTYDEAEATEESTDEGAAGSEPGLGDIFNRTDTKTELKLGVAVFGLVGVGLGLGVVLADAFESGVFGWGLLAAGIVLAPLLAVLIGQRQSGELAGLPDNVTYGTAAITAIAGTLTLGVVVWVFGGILDDFAVPDLGDFLLPVIGMGLGAAVAAVGVIWVMENLAGDA